MNSGKVKSVAAALVGVALFLVGVLSGFQVQPYYEHTTCRAQYQNVNPDFVCEGRAYVVTKSDYAALKRKIRDYIEGEQEAGRVTHISLYFRDLYNGPTMGIDETAPYAPASLLKVPLSLLYMGMEEESPGFLKGQPPLKFERPPELKEGEDVRSALNLYQAYEPIEEIQPGRPYSVEDLLFRMLVYSDNSAYMLLVQHAYQGLGGEAALAQVFRELGIINPDNLAEETISVRGYAGIWRQLYNGSYLKPELSEKVLGWLAQSDFDAGIEAGVPEGVRVAHKFGERELKETKTMQLHDCGIVYYPENPYLLCIMTKGKDVHELAPVIARISEMVYQEFDSRRID